MTSLLHAYLKDCAAWASTLTDDPPAKQLRGECAAAIRRSLHSEFQLQSERITDSLLDGLSHQCKVAPGIVLGHGLTEVLLPQLSKDALVLTDIAPWNFIAAHLTGADRLRDELAFIQDITSGVELNALIRRATTQPPSRLLGIGAGRTMDLLKFIGWKSGLPMISIVTSLSSHVYASPKIHALKPIRDLGYDATIDGQPPQMAILDLDLLAKVNETNPRLIRSGFGDVMALFTAVEDWKLATANGFGLGNLVVEKVTHDILALLETVPVEEPLSSWASTFTLAQTLLCHVTDWVGSAPASGSEHLFAHCVEALAGSGPLHGEVVALGTLIMSQIQGADTNRILRCMNQFHLPRSLREVGITRDQAIQSLLACSAAGKRKKRFTILDVVDPSRQRLESVVDSLLASRALLP